MNCRKLISSSLVAMLFGAFAVTGALAQPSNQNQNQLKNKGGGLGGGATILFDFNLGNQEKSQTKKPVKRKSTKTTKQKKKKNKTTKAKSKGRKTRSSNRKTVVDGIIRRINDDNNDMSYYFKNRSRMGILLKYKNNERVRVALNSVIFSDSNLAGRTGAHCCSDFEKHVAENHALTGRNGSLGRGSTESGLVNDEMFDLNPPVIISDEPTEPNDSTPNKATTSNVDPKVRISYGGGDCCSDLEERVAELEATTARRSNRRLTFTINGIEHETFLFWDGDTIVPTAQDPNLNTRRENLGYIRDMFEISRIDEILRNTKMKEAEKRANIKYRNAIYDRLAENIRPLLPGRSNRRYPIN